MPGYKLIVKNAKVTLKTVYNAVLNITGIKDLLTGTGSVDSNNKINWTLQEYTDTAANFTANNPVLLLGQKGIETDDLLTAPKFKIGNGITAWNSLPYAGGSGVQSVTGASVDNTDPLNPIVNNLGLIKIVDLAGELFTDLATAITYIEQFFTNPLIITNRSFENGVFFFSVPPNTQMDLADGFLNNSEASFIDNFGFIIEFQNGIIFYNNSAKHIFGNIFFNVDEAFTNAELDCECNDFAMDSNTAFASNTTGTFKIKGLIDPASASSGFFSASTATLLVSSILYTSNAGNIDASVGEAILNGCNVQFEGINLEKVSNKQTDLTASATKYPTVNAVNTGLASKVGVIAKDITTSSALTGTTAITLLKSVLIPANSFTSGNIAVIQARAIRNTATGTSICYLYINTSNTLSGATLIGIIGSAVRFYGIERNLFIKSSTVSETLDVSAASNTDASTNNSAANSDLNIDWTVNQYIIHAFANAAVGNSTVSSGLIVNKM